ncbi:MAG: OB-fold domain-containing protein [Deltaproteobacteria bacterium]|nr:OB-fold domain-containing protein [Deltaproteobacteria bacterium]MBW2396420.1 OB-fold domain-containing protein [Deltaproteobacteria bacterium]
MLLPAVGENEAPFWEAAAKGELRIQQCAGCERLRFPPRPMCPRCQSTESTWALMSGGGTIYSFVVPHPPLLPQFNDLAPYNVILVTLDEDPTIRLIGNLVDQVGDKINAVDPSSIELDKPVQVVFEQINDDIHMPRWLRV